ncbi:MAG: hypothetical protein AB8C13_03735 [Phycisphaerales bacterium]
MPIHARPGEQYTIRRKILKIFGAAFHVYDEHGSVVGYCKQKAFKLKEDIRLYTDESMADPLLTLQARSIIDFGATYDITLPDGSQLGSLRRKGLKSTFLRDEWVLFDDQGKEVGTMREKNLFLSFMRRGDLSAFFPQRFEFFTSGSDEPVAFVRQHFNLFVYRLGLSVLKDDENIDELLLLGATCLIAAIEGRQS